MKKRQIFIFLVIVLSVFSIENFTYTQEEESSPEESGYTLGPGDVIEISVWKDEELTDKFVIQPDGKLSFPLIGEIQTKGRTVGEVRQEIQEKIKEYVPDSPVTVILREIHYPKVYVVGKVLQPGVFIMDGEPLTVLQALALAGGMTDFADKDDIIVIRKLGKERTVFRFNYGKVSRGKDLEQNIELQPGDTVVVP